MSGLGSRTRRKLHNALSRVAERSPPIVFVAEIFQEGQLRPRHRKTLAKSVQAARSTIREHLRHAATQARYAGDFEIIKTVETIRFCTETIFYECRAGAVATASAALNRQKALIDGARAVIHSLRGGLEHRRESMAATPPVPGEMGFPVSRHGEGVAP